MTLTLDPLPFELAGSFGGFVFTGEGKRRMLLRVQQQEVLLKVPRELRRRIIGKFRPGELIRVAGTGERDAVTGVLRRVVSRVLPDGVSGTSAVETSRTPFTPPTPVTLAAAGEPIRVCTKKHCWRNGGRELWDALGREVAARGLEERIELRQVGCLGRCKNAPNLDRGRREEHSRCSPGVAAAIIDRAAAALALPANVA